MNSGFALEGIMFAIPLFCIATMFAIGLNSTFEEAFVAPFRNLLALAIVVLVNNVFVPLLGIITLILLGMLSPEMFSPINSDSSYVSPEFGFLLLMLASGTLLGPALATISGAEKTFAKGIVVILIVISALTIPLMLELIRPLSVVNLPTSSVTLFVTLLTYQLIPLLIGMIIKVQYEAIALRLRPIILQLTSLTFVILLALLSLVVLENRDFQPQNIITYSVVALIIIILIITIGYYGGVAVRNVVKAENEDIPRSLATSTAIRNVSFALILLWNGVNVDESSLLTNSVTVVLIIYMISLILSSHQAVQWGKAAAKEASQNNVVAEQTEVVAS